MSDATWPPEGGASIDVMHGGYTWRAVAYRHPLSGEVFLRWTPVYVLASSLMAASDAAAAAGIPPEACVHLTTAVLATHTFEADQVLMAQCFLGAAGASELLDGVCSKLGRVSSLDAAVELLSELYDLDDATWPMPLLEALLGNLES